MAERRSIWKALCTSRKVNKLSLKAEILYDRSIAWTDRDGYMEAEADFIKASIFPMRKNVSEKEIPLLVQEIVDVGLWEPFHVTDNGTRVIQEKQFRRFQPISPTVYAKEAPSRFAGNLSPGFTTPGVVQEDARSTPTEEKGREVKRREENNNKIVGVFFNCEYFLITDDYHQQLLNEFPLIDFESLFKRLRDYISDEPSKYKRLPTGRLKHPKLVIRNWCEREKIKGGSYETRNNEPSAEKILDTQWKNMSPRERWPWLQKAEKDERKQVMDLDAVAYQIFMETKLAEGEK